MSQSSFENSIDLTRVSIDLPLFDQFFELALAIAQQSTHGTTDPIDEHWLEVLNGFMLHPSHQWTNGRYDCTPLNTLEFANTGVDGEHFSFLVENHQITSHSPVIYTAPCHFTGPKNVIIAPNFEIFLRLGLKQGFFELGNLLDSPVQTLQKLRGEPSFESESPCLEYDDKEILSAIATHLKLKPYCCSINDFIDLQLRYLPHLVMSQEYLNSCDD